MTTTHALFLGVLQGLTEFLPVSSSGHLVLAEKLLNIHFDPQAMQSLNVILHAGTLFALLCVYTRTWVQLLTAPFVKDQQKTKQLILLIIATIPAGIAGIFFEDWIAEHFQSLFSVGLAFLATACVLLLAECAQEKKKSLLQKMLHPRTKNTPLGVRFALAIGTAQAMALVPGLSRSGLTISAGRMMGLDRKTALDFSFLMAVPVIGGATLLTVKDLFTGNAILVPINVAAIGIASSFVWSLLAILFLRRMVVRFGLGWFAPYLIALSTVTIFLAVV